MRQPGAVWRVTLDEHWDYNDEGEYERAEPVNVFAANAEDAVEAAKMMAVSQKIEASKDNDADACECIGAVLHSVEHVCDVDTCAIVAEETEA